MGKFKECSSERQVNPDEYPIGLLDNQLTEEAAILDFLTSSLITQTIFSQEFMLLRYFWPLNDEEYTEQRSKELGLRGYVMNTPKGTVTGQLEGEAPKVEEMKAWLQSVGSPMSKIDRASFKGPREIKSYSYTDFSVRR